MVNFEGLALAYEAGRAGGTLPAVWTAAAPAGAARAAAASPTARSLTARM